MIDLFMERSSGMQAYETLREKVKIAWYASVTQPVINFRGGGGVLFHIGQLYKLLFAFTCVIFV